MCRNDDSRDYSNLQKKLLKCHECPDWSETYCLLHWLTQCYFIKAFSIMPLYWRHLDYSQIGVTFLFQWVSPGFPLSPNHSSNAPFLKPPPLKTSFSKPPSPKHPLLALDYMHVGVTFLLQWFLSTFPLPPAPPS